VVQHIAELADLVTQVLVVHVTAVLAVAGTALVFVNKLIKQKSVIFGNDLTRDKIKATQYLII